LRLNAYAKINLTLDVLGDRPDGYHDIETVLHTVELHDTIILRENGEGISIRCASPDVPPSDRTSCTGRRTCCRKPSRSPEGSRSSCPNRSPWRPGWA